MGKVAAIVNCECCNKELSSITTYHYGWNKKTPVENKILPSDNLSDDTIKVILVDRRWTKHCGYIYKKKDMPYFCEYTFKFSGLLSDGDSARRIHFSTIKCSECMDAAFKNEDSFEYKVNERFKEKEKEIRLDLQLIHESEKPLLDAFGLITFGFSTINGYNLQDTEKNVKKLMDEVFKCEFEYVYSYTEELNPDRDGIYVMVRPTKLL